MIYEVSVASLLLAGSSASSRSGRASRYTRPERTSWWRRRKSQAAETAPPRLFEHADARARAHAHVDLTVAGSEPRKRFWQKELRLRRRGEELPAVFAVEDESSEAADDDWFVSDAPQDAIEPADQAETKLGEEPRRRWFGRKAKGDDSEVEEVLPVDAPEDDPVAEEKPRRRWFGRKEGSDEVEVDEVLAVDASEDEPVAEEKPRRRWFGRKEQDEVDEVDEIAAVEAVSSEPARVEEADEVPAEVEVDEPVAEEKPRRRWFGRKEKHDEVDEVEVLAAEADADELVAEEKPRRWFGRKEGSDEVEVDEVLAVDASEEEPVAEEKPRRRWFGRKEEQDELDEVDELVALEVSADETVAEEKSARRWFGRKEKGDDVEVEEVFAVETDAEELAAEEKPRRRWFGRKEKQDEVDEVDELVALEPDADELVAEEKSHRRWFRRKRDDAAVLPVDEAPDDIPPVHVESGSEQDAEDNSRRRWFSRSKQDDAGQEPSVEAVTAPGEAIELEPAAKTRDDQLPVATDEELPAVELPLAESLPAPSRENDSEVEADSANRQVRELLAWWNEVQAAAGNLEQPPAEAAPAEPQVESVDEPVPAEPVAVEPVAVEPVAVEPVAVEPVAVQPVSVEPVAETDSGPPAEVLPEPVRPEPTQAKPVADAAETLEIKPQPVEPVAVEPAVPVVASAAEPVVEVEAAPAKKRGLSFSVRRGKKADSEDFPQPERTRKSEPKAAKAKRSRGVKKIVGLKIGASQIAAAQVANNGSPELVQLARQEMEAGIVVGGELRDPEALAEALTEFFKKHKLPKKSVRLGIASNRIGVRSFQITGIDDPKQLTNAVRFRAQDALPIPLNEAALDYQVLEESVDETGATVRRVLLVVAYRDLVDRYVQACRKAGIKLIGVDLEAFAVLRALAAPRPAEVAPAGALVVVSIGHDRSTLAVSDGRVCEFTRVLDWGGASLDVALARALDVTPRETDSVKRHLSLDGTGPLPHGLTEDQAAKARQAMLDQINVFARELVSSLHFYQSQPGSLEIGEIVLTGGGSHLDGLADHLQQLTGVTVRVGDPLVRMTLKKKAETPDPLGSLAVAIGLGIED